MEEYIKSPEELEIEDRIEWFKLQCPFDKKCEPQIAYKYNELGGKVFVLQCCECGRISHEPIARRTLENIDYINIEEIPKINNRVRGKFHSFMLEKSLKKDETAKMREEYEHKIAQIISKDKKDHLSSIVGVEWTNMDQMYDLYLECSHWVNKRNQILKRDKFRCRLCGKKADNVHHTSYNNLGQESDLELISLCESCHLLLHRGIEES